MSEGAALEGRHVVVTGGQGALGRAVVARLAAAGAVCHLPVREARPEAAPARVHVREGVDLTDERAVASFYASLPGLWASVQLAGGFAALPFVETPLAELRRQLDLNLVTCFLACREAVRVLRAAGGGGRIVNVSARPALVPTPGMAAYATAKTAVAGLTRALAEEVREEGILVNAIVPSIIDTPANRAAMPEAEHHRWPRPEELAEAIAFLVSPACTVAAGELVRLYGRV